MSCRVPSTISQRQLLCFSPTRLQKLRAQRWTREQLLSCHHVLQHLVRQARKPSGVKQLFICHHTVFLSPQGLEQAIPVLCNGLCCVAPNHCALDTGRNRRTAMETAPVVADKTCAQSLKLWLGNCSSNSSLLGRRMSKRSRYGRTTRNRLTMTTGCERRTGRCDAIAMPTYRRTESLSKRP